ncbi:MAG: AMP-binding protein [Rhizobiaceae bacterium]
MNIASLLSENAKAFRANPAVSEAGGSVSYDAFMRRTGTIAANFHAAGLRPGDRVALCMHNCAEYLEVLFACWTAGLCAVPMNAKLHPREVEQIVADSGAKLLFATDDLVESLAPLERSLAGLRIVCVGTDGYARLLKGEAIAPVAAAATDPAWIFYTSGTTGRSKGAVLSHRVLLFMSMAYYADIDSVGPTDSKLHVSPLSHGSGLFAIPHMLRGSHQVVLDGFEPQSLVDTINAHRNISMFMVPTILSRVVNTGLHAEMKTGNLRTIYYGGAPMYVSDLKRAVEIFPGKLYHLFGQGESPMTITGLAKDAHAADVLETCGTPRTGVRVRVVDDEGRDLPAGEVGEVITTSDCVMTGYWGNEAATAAALKDGWLHTGDLGSMDERGYLTLKDRSKDLIISGGSNIYPREIEEILLSHPDIVEASVIGRPHADWGEEVVAFVVKRAGSDVGPAALDALCLANIARFKRPKQYRFLDALPKSDYGKILKKKLREIAD